MRVYAVIGSFYGGPNLNKLLSELPELLKGYDWNLLLNRQFDSYPRGFAVVYNQLVNAAFTDHDAKYVWILNDDVLPTGNALRTCMATMDADPTIGSIFPTEIWNECGKVRALNPLPKDRRYDIPADEAMKTGPELLEHIYATGACMCVSFDAWHAVGEMDESLGRGYGEDLDWGIRCWRAGFRVVNHRRSQFWHVRSATFDRIKAEGRLKVEDDGIKNGRVTAKYPFITELGEEEAMKMLRDEYDRRSR